MHTSHTSKENLVLIGMLIACILLFALTAAQTFAGDNHSEKARQADTGQNNSVSTVSLSTLRELAKEAITSHPSDQIAKDLHGLILEGNVLLNLQSLASGFDAAAFTHQDGKPVLSISPNLLTDGRAKSPYTQLVIFHEYQHIKEHRSFVRFLPKFGQVQESRESFEGLLEAEKNAYTAECKLATELSLENTEGLEFCAAYRSGNAKFMDELYKYLNSRPYYTSQFLLYGIDTL